MLAHAVVGNDFGGLGLFEYVPGNHDSGHESGDATENTGNSCDQHRAKISTKNAFCQGFLGCLGG